jgi:hypothetical protein
LLGAASAGTALDHAHYGQQLLCCDNDTPTTIQDQCIFVLWGEIAAAVYCKVIIMGLIIGSLFYNVPAGRSGVRMLLGASFITIM